ncbi:MAG: DUF4405 domain-containing protein [Methylococcaceae bacterium]|nr:DUF4405 domain-containing protein [Methylococcaceae bacterium]
MKRANLNIIIDILAFCCFLFLTTTGILIHYVLPKGSGYYRTLWGLDRHQWGSIHLWIAVIFFAILAIHLILHWRWLLNIFKNKPSQHSGFRLGLGLVSFFALLAVAIAPLVSPVNTVERYPEDSQFSKEIMIKGSMTLEKLERDTGVSATYLIKELNLPIDTPHNERLGILKNKYGFKMSAVKKAIFRYEKVEHK